jgi:hypothetical protein
MDIYGHLWTFMDNYGQLWTLMDIYGHYGHYGPGSYHAGPLCMIIKATVQLLLLLLLSVINTAWGTTVHYVMLT